MKKFACGVEDAEAFGSELVALVHLSRTVERSAQVGEPTLLPIRDAIATGSSLRGGMSSIP
jgi:hypothetical protein